MRILDRFRAWRHRRATYDLAISVDVYLVRIDNVGLTAPDPHRPDPQAMLGQTAKVIRHHSGPGLVRLLAVTEFSRQRHLADSLAAALETHVTTPAGTTGRWLIRSLVNGPGHQTAADPLGYWARLDRPAAIVLVLEEPITASLYPGDPPAEGEVRCRRLTYQHGLLRAQQLIPLDDLQS